MYTHRAKCCKGTQRPRCDYTSLEKLTHKHKAKTDTQKQALELNSKRRTNKDFKEEMA